MESVGTFLRSERKRQGRNIPDIATALCITPAYIQAIEADDLPALPGTFFYKSFVRQYAALLGIAENRIRPRLDAMMVAAEEPPLPGQDPRNRETQSLLQAGWISEVRQLLRSFRADPAGGPAAPMGVLDPVVESTNQYFTGHRLGASVAVLVAVLLGCSGFYAWWNRAPKAVTVEVVHPAPAASPLQTVSKASPDTPSSPPSIDVTASQSPDGRAVLNLSATDEVWISVTANGKEVFSGVLKPSQTKTLTGIEAAQMKVGNAGGLDARWNGKPIGPIGPRGQVRTVVLTPENFEILPPKPTADDAL